MAKKRSNWRKEKARDATPKERAYRAALNRENRKRGTYGNGDGLDVSHSKSGGRGTTKLEKASSNRARKPSNWRGNKKRGK
jgi:hypothetical protein